MKKLITLSLSVAAGIVSVFAQAPNRLSYQAIVRNSSGVVVPNGTNVSFRFTIRDGSAGGSIVYQETVSQSVNNAFGQVAVQIGGGAVQQGSFPTASQWGGSTKFLQVEIDPAGGSSYTDMGATQLISTPYAQYANGAGTANTLSGTITPSQISQGGASIGQVMQWNGSNWVPSAGLSAGTGLSFAGNTLNSVWTTSGNSIYNNNSSNVGVGTSTPTSKLHVKGSGEAVRFELAKYSWLGFYDNNKYIGYLGPYNDTAGLDFGTSGSGMNVNIVTGATKRLTVFNDGRVGINAPNPGYMFQVHSNGSTYPETQYTSTTTGTGSTDGFMVGLNTFAGEGLIFNWENQDISIGTNSAERMRVKNTGLIGIGTSSPAAILHTRNDRSSTDFNVQFEQSTTSSAALSLVNSTPNGIHLFALPTTAGGFNVGSATNAWAPVNASAFNVSSDRTLKKEIHTIEGEELMDYLKQIRSIESATYRYNWETNEMRPYAHVGFIAQTLPLEATVRMSANADCASETKMGYNLSDMMGLSIIGIKALDQKNQELQKQVADLQAQIATLVKQMEALQAAQANK